VHHKPPWRRLALTFMRLTLVTATACTHITARRRRRRLNARAPAYVVAAGCVGGGRRRRRRRVTAALAAAAAQVAETHWQASDGAQKEAEQRLEDDAVAMIIERLLDAKPSLYWHFTRQVRMDPLRPARPIAWCD
jgi:hypothetical protein